MLAITPVPTYIHTYTHTHIVYACVRHETVAQADIIYTYIHTYMHIIPTYMHIHRYIHRYTYPIVLAIQKPIHT